jgi:hypothetical protein
MFEIVRSTCDSEVTSQAYGFRVGVEVCGCSVWMCFVMWFIDEVAEGRLRSMHALLVLDYGIVLDRWGARGVGRLPFGTGESTGW